MSEATKIKILIVDDHPVVRIGIAAIIDTCPDMTTVAQSSTAEEAIKLFDLHLPDITLMDLRLPGMSGVAAIRRIRASHPEARIIVLTTYEGDEDIHQALEAGARGYLIKGMSREVLLHAIIRVHGGSQFLPPTVTRALEARSKDSALSARERQVLVLIVSGKSNKEIGSALGIAEATVKCHVTEILSHLQVSDRTQAVVTALRRGLVHL
jgi:two-component system, NarL family, response regulator